MNYEAAGTDQKTEQDRQYIESLIQRIKEFTPEKTAGSWSPEEGGEVIVALNRLYDTMIKKAAEIKHYVRTLTVEELNELDGFARCNIVQPNANQTNMPKPY